MSINKPLPVVTHIVSGDLWAGAEVQVYHLCRALKASGAVLPTAVVFNDGILSNKLQEIDIPVDIADETNLSPFQITLTIRNHCRKHKSCVVHTHGFKENILGIIGKDLARVPYSVRTIHGNPETAFTPQRPVKWLIQHLDLLLGRFRQQAIIAVSTQLEEKLQSMFPGKVHKIFNFIDVDDVRKQWLIPEKTPQIPLKIGIVGRLVAVKRMDIFLRTVALLNEQSVACTGVIIGSGPLEGQLRQLAEDLDISDHIEFTGFVNPALRELRKLDLLLMTSDHEGLPMTLLEALALEIPVAAHRVGGIPEILDHGNCGWLVEDQSAESYASIATTILETGAGRNRKQQEGLARVRDIFGIHKNTLKYIELYKNDSG